MSLSSFLIVLLNFNILLIILIIVLLINISSIISILTSSIISLLCERGRISFSEHKLCLLVHPEQ